MGAPIKNRKSSNRCNSCYENTWRFFSYANQLGQRQGAGAVYLNVHHPDILSFLDTKRENADEKLELNHSHLVLLSRILLLN